MKSGVRGAEPSRNKPIAAIKSRQKDQQFQRQYSSYFADGTATRGLGCTATLASADGQILERLHRLMQAEGRRRLCGSVWYLSRNVPCEAHFSVGLKILILNLFTVLLPSLASRILHVQSFRHTLFRLSSC